MENQIPQDGPDDDPAAEAALVARAVDGDPAAVTAVVNRLQDPIYRLALRMTGRPADAEDATQEILLRVLTHLADWRAEARLRTWAYRIGVNHLLNLRRKSPQEQAQLDLQAFGDRLAEGLATDDHRGADAELLATEVRLQCSQAMLQCLTRQERVAFVLADVFELGSTEAAWILDITPEAFRKRLQRTKARLGAFLTSTCGRTDETAWCRCTRRTRTALALGRVNADRPVFATHPVTAGGRDAHQAEQQMIRLHGAAAIFRAHPDYALPENRLPAVAELIRSGRFPMLNSRAERRHDG